MYKKRVENLLATKLILVTYKHYLQGLYTIKSGIKNRLFFFKLN